MSLPNSRTYECYFTQKKGFCRDDYIPGFETGDYSGLPTGAQCNEVSLEMAEGGLMTEVKWVACWGLEQPVLASKVEEGASTTECKLPLEAGKGKKISFLLDPPERNAALVTPQWDLYLISDLQHFRMINLHRFKPLHLWECVTEANN